MKLINNKSQGLIWQVVTILEIKLTINSIFYFLSEINCLLLDKKIIHHQHRLSLAEWTNSHDKLMFEF